MSTHRDRGPFAAVFGSLGCVGAYSAAGISAQVGSSCVTRSEKDPCVVTVGRPSSAGVATVEGVNGKSETYCRRGRASGHGHMDPSSPRSRSGVGDDTERLDCTRCASIDRSDPVGQILDQQRREYRRTIGR